MDAVTDDDKSWTQIPGAEEAGRKDIDGSGKEHTQTVLSQ